MAELFPKIANTAQLATIQDVFKPFEEPEMPWDGGEIVPYGSGSSMVRLRHEGEGRLWATARQIAAVFHLPVENVNTHIRNIYAEGLLDSNATQVSEIRPGTEGQRQVDERSSITTYTSSMPSRTGRHPREA